MNEWQKPEDFFTDVEQIMIDSGVLNKDGSAKFTFDCVCGENGTPKLVNPQRIKCTQCGRGIDMKGTLCQHCSDSFEKVGRLNEA